MSKRKYVERRTILSAIRHEPLASGNWVKYVDGKPLTDPNCKVCAVGAVLRKAGFGNIAIDNFGNNMLEYGGVVPESFDSHELTIERNMKEYLEQKQYLHALSLKFETQAEKLAEASVHALSCASSCSITSLLVSNWTWPFNPFSGVNL